MPTTIFANLPDGLQFLSLFDQAFAQTVALYPPVIVTTSGTYTIAPTQFGDTLSERSVAGNFQLPPAASRANQPVGIADIAGNAATFNQTILPFGSETIMGLSSIVLTSNYEGVTLWPIPTGGWYMK